tara:strand:+ start:1109 stop:1270 length:162 start_codon:yes stop_codon:yes gene_type:complete
MIEFEDVLASSQRFHRESTNEHRAREKPTTARSSYCTAHTGLRVRRRVAVSVL